MNSKGLFVFFVLRGLGPGGWVWGFVGKIVKVHCLVKEYNHWIRLQVPLFHFLVEEASGGTWKLVAQLPTYPSSKLVPSSSSVHVIIVYLLLFTIAIFFTVHLCRGKSEM